MMNRLRSFDGLVLGLMVALLAAILLVATQDNPAVAAADQLIFTRLDAENREQLFALPIDLEVLSVAESTDGVWATEGMAIQLSESEVGVWDFAVSADGAQIAYSSLNQDGSSDLWRLRRDAELPEYLLACPSASCNSPAWSPDDRFLAFTRRGAELSSSTGGLSPPRLWLLNIETGETAQIFSDNQVLGFNPLWSAGGNWISYLSPELNGVSVYNLESGESRYYETQTGEPGVWHPSEDKLLLSMMSQVDGQYRIHLYLADPNNEELINLSGDLAVEDSSVAWSPDGEVIGFRRKELEGDNVTRGKQLWMMKRDGMGASPLTQAADFDHGQPIWSADGRWLLYHRFPLRGPDIVLSIWLTDIHSGNQFEIARPGQRPQWFQ